MRSIISISFMALFNLENIGHRACSLRTQTFSERSTLVILELTCRQIYSLPLAGPTLDTLDWKWPIAMNLDGSPNLEKWSFKIIRMR